jgi:hypothetical protein
MPTGIYLIDNPPRTQQFRCPRRVRPSGIIGVHTAEAIGDETGPDSGAENVARFIANRTTFGSYHLLADSDSIIQLVEFRCVAYHIGTHGLNEHTIGISAAAQAAKWNSYSKAWREATVRNMARAAARAARWLHRTYGITVPARRITLAQALNGQRGFLAHGDADPDRRTDPGATFPWTLFLSTYAAEMADSGTDPEKDWFDMATKQDLADVVDERLDNHIVKHTDKNLAWHLRRLKWLLENPITSPISGNPRSPRQMLQDTSGSAHKAAQAHELLVAVAGSLEGLDTAAVLARMDEHHAASAAQLEALSQGQEAAAAERTELRTLIDAALSGERDAVDTLRTLHEILGAALPDDADAPA